MEKLKMESLNMTQCNIEKIGALFPQVITEAVDDNGKLVKAIDFEKLRQELSSELLGDGEESYDFTWVGKNQAIVEANEPIRKTLRPVVETETVPTGEDSKGNPYCSSGSKNFDTTENLYIEGDNLDVLKLLQESYLNSIKMIYIDPPYNTGKDSFVYPDNYTIDKSDYEEQIEYRNEDGEIVFGQNNETNARFHSDWCSMIYMRLKLARNLLVDGGVIFISIDDNEQANLQKICDEVFGETNCLGPIIQNKQNAKNDTQNIQRNHEFVLVYRKTVSEEAVLRTVKETYRDVFVEGEKYYYVNDAITTRGEGGILNARPNLGYTVYYNPVTRDKIAEINYDVSLAKTSNSEEDLYIENESLLAQGYVAIRPPKVRGNLGCWTWSVEKFNDEKENIIITGKAGSYAVKKRTFVDPKDVKTVAGKLQYVSRVQANSRSILDFSTNDGTNALNLCFGQKGLFSNAKNISMLKYLMNLLVVDDDIVLDFFSGSATSAHAVMELNAEDGGNRKFICVQLPETTYVLENGERVAAKGSEEAFKARYMNICEIGKERIRRAGEKIKAEIEESNAQLEIGEEPKQVPDIGFRVLKLDSTNMKDVYYGVEEITQTILGETLSNIKEDRTGLDLLYGVLLDWGLELSSSCEILNIDGVTVYNYDDASLVACLEDKKVSETAIREIAKMQPRRVVFRDSSFESSPDKINVEEIFKLTAPGTSVKVI